VAHPARFKEVGLETSRTGKVALLGALKDGKPDGLWTWWDENGIKEDLKGYSRFRTSR
jgi:hypothetical protein